MAKIKNIIFDLDGTLWDSREQILNAWNKVLKDKCNLYLNIDDFNDLMGKTSEDYKNAFFKNYTPEEADYFLKLCENEEVIYLKKHGGNIFKNSISTIKKLTQNYNLFIVSNCQNGYIESFLSHYNLNQYFKDFECNGRTGYPKDKNIKLIMERNNLSNSNTCYIGDTYGDYISTINNNILFIHATYGFGKCNQATHYINDISEITELISKMN